MIWCCESEIFTGPVHVIFRQLENKVKFWSWKINPNIVDEITIFRSGAGPISGKLIQLCYVTPYVLNHRMSFPEIDLIIPQNSQIYNWTSFPEFAD